MEAKKKRGKRLPERMSFVVGDGELAREGCVAFVDHPPSRQGEWVANGAEGGFQILTPAELVRWTERMD